MFIVDGIWYAQIIIQKSNYVENLLSCSLNFSVYWSVIFHVNLWLATLVTALAKLNSLLFVYLNLTIFCSKDTYWRNLILGILSWVNRSNFFWNQYFGRLIIFFILVDLFKNFGRFISFFVWRCFLSFSPHAFPLFLTIVLTPSKVKKANVICEWKNTFKVKMMDPCTGCNLQAVLTE